MTDPNWGQEVAPLDVHSGEPSRTGVPLSSLLGWLENWGLQFIEGVVRAVVKAIVGVLLPGPAAQQLADWAAGVVGDVGSALGQLTNLIGSFFGGPGQTTGDLGGILRSLFGLFPGFLDNGDGTLNANILAEFVDNLDGTWSFVENGIHTLIDNGDGTLMSPVEWLQNLSGQLGTYQNTINQQQAIIDSIINSLGRETQIFGNQVGLLENALQNIDFLNILGIGGPADIGSTIETTWNQILGGFLDIVDPIGGNLSDLFNVTNIIGSWANLGLQSFDILGIRNAQPTNSGMLASSTTTVPALTATQGTSANMVGVTNSTAITSWQRIEKDTTFGAIRWHGFGTTNITAFQVALHRMRPGNPQGDTHMDPVYVSPDIVADLDPGGSMSLPLIQAHDFTDTPVTFVAGDWLGTELIPHGSGTHYVNKMDIWAPPDPHVVPRRLASVRDQSSAPMSGSLLDIYDDFDAINSGSARWDLPYTFGTPLGGRWTYSGGATVSASQLVLPSSGDKVESVSHFNVSGLPGGPQCIVQVPLVAAGAQTTSFELVDPSGDVTRIYQNNGNLFFDEVISGSHDQTSVTYSAATHQWWRLRYDSGVFYWDTSSDAISWTNRRFKTPSASMDLSNVFVRLYTDGSNAKFDHVNIIPGENLATVTTIPLIETAVDLGVGLAFHSPRPVQMDDDGTVAIPLWANTIQPVGVGGGGGGERGVPFDQGEGAAAGSWAATTWTRGTHFDDSTGFVTFDIGAGGIGQNAAGSNNPTTGGATVISIPGHSITANGGVPGTVAPIQSLPGKSPGAFSYDGVPYAGGLQQNNGDAAGNTPGGGGAGGLSSTSIRPGGPGANGRGWVRFIQ